LQKTKVQYQLDQTTQESHFNRTEAYRGFAISLTSKGEANQRQEAKDEQRPKLLELARPHPCQRSTGTMATARQLVQWGIGKEVYPKIIFDGLSFYTLFTRGT
jgi:hypothetical protein